MNATISEQFEVVRRILDKLKIYGETCALSPLTRSLLLDFQDHLRTEVNYLRGYVEDALRERKLDSAS